MKINLSSGVVIVMSKKEKMKKVHSPYEGTPVFSEIFVAKYNNHFKNPGNA